MTYLSVDIGGTKIRVIEYDKNLRIKENLLFQTNKFFRGKKENFNEFINYLSSTLKNNQFYKIGLSINCYIKDNKIIYSSLLGGKVKIDLKNVFKKYFKFKHLNADNDVICAAKAELKYGWGKKYNFFVYVNIGSGVRIVSVDNGKLALGANRLAGEISDFKIYYSYDKKVSYEKLLGGKYISKRGDAEKYFKSLSFIQKYLDNLANLLSLIGHVYDPEIIILGGSVSRSIKKYDKLLKEKYHSLEHFLFIKKIVYSSLNFPESIGALLNF